MWLNIYGNRSFNDLSQYPVFPWLITNYEDPIIDEVISEWLKKSPTENKNEGKNGNKNKKNKENKQDKKNKKNNRKKLERFKFNE